MMTTGMVVIGAGGAGAYSGGCGVAMVVSMATVAIMRSAVQITSEKARNFGDGRCR